MLVGMMGHGASAAQGQVLGQQQQNSRQALTTVGRVLTRREWNLLVWLGRSK